MSTLTRAAVYTVRIAAVTAATPVLAGAAAASATAKLAGWEFRQLASSPLSGQARRLTAESGTENEPASWTRASRDASSRSANGHARSAVRLCSAPETT